MSQSSAGAGGTEPYETYLTDVRSFLASSLDYEETLAAVAELAVRSLADFCIIDIVEGDEVRRLQVAHADPERAELTRELLRFPLDHHRPHLSLTALATGKAVLVPDMSSGILESMVQGDEHRRILDALRPISFMAVPLLARDRLLGVVLFVSSSHNYDEGDLALAERLVQLAAQEVDNARLYREAQQALQARDRVLGIVAHDLRDPLNTIHMSAALLLDPSFSQVQQTRQAQMILRSVKRMDRLIHDLLDVARLEADWLSLHREILDPGELVAEAVELHTPVAEARSISLRYERDDAIPTISADRDRLLQVLSNLLGNAIKFTPEGGSIEVRTEGVDGAMCFSVSDTGPGIPAEDLPRLFQPFWQAKQGSLDGAGLGLMIARGIAEAHDGTIRAESVPGQGSTFYFTIPAVGALPEGERRTGAGDRRSVSPTFARAPLPQFPDATIPPPANRE